MKNIKNKFFTDEDIAKLIIKAQNGGQLEYETLINIFSMYMEKDIRDIAKSKLVEYEDLKQIAMIGLVNAVKNYKECFYKPKTIIGVCMKRQMMDEIKKLDAGKRKIDKFAKCYGLLIEENDYEYLSIYDNVNESILSKVLTKELYDFTENIIDDNCKQKQAKYMKMYIHGYEIYDISEIEKVNYKTVATHIYRAKSKVKVKLMEYLTNNIKKVAHEDAT